jgi:TRAP-type mannitol/chloroaromatic compound transport system permease small subunit
VKALLRLSRAIDRLNEAIGQFVSWLILIAVLVSAGNAIVRKALHASSNALLEVQWYLFSAVFLLGAAYTLLRNEHVRIDVLSVHFAPRTRAWVEVLGTLFFLLPMAILLTWLSWPMFVESYLRHEVSGDAGGLLRWPVKILVPLGFFLLGLQGLSELIKRLAFLLGYAPEPYVSPAHHVILPPPSTRTTDPPSA